MLSALRLIQDSGSAEMYDLRQMQNRLAGELSLQQTLCDLTNFLPGSLHRDWRPQLLPDHQLREPGQVSRSNYKAGRVKYLPFLLYYLTPLTCRITNVPSPK
jgi:hypothetical protein